jgi:cytochrome bd ubiquinol oxidase subunit II
MIPVLLDYETLRFTWWILLGVLVIGFAIMDGFDMGMAFLHPFIARTDNERRIILNIIGPVWEGNQVWLILGIGAIFAAFPQIYATAFSSFYWVMLLILLSLILRPVSFEYRHHCAPQYRYYWDITLFFSGLFPPFVFGMLVGHQFLGLPFSFDAALQSHYHGGFLSLFDPFALLCGVVSLCMFIVNGGLLLLHKTTEMSLQERAKKAVCWAFYLWFFAFFLAAFYLSRIDGYIVSGHLLHNGPSNPLLKTVIRLPGGWFTNYQTIHALWAIPIGTIFFGILSKFLMKKRHYLCAWIASAYMTAGTIITAGVALFPFLMTSSFIPSHSLTLWDASSSHLSLWLMLIAACLFVPLIIFYTSWIFHVLRGSINKETIINSKDHLY